MTELECLLVLNAVPGLGNARIKGLLEVFGSAGKVLSANAKELAAKNIIPRLVLGSIGHFDADQHLKKEFELIKKHDVKVVAMNDADYPESLKEIPDAPVLLYVKGSVKKDNLGIAVVGSRRASLYGVAMAEKIAIGLAELGVTIVSGMARGVDTAAHRGALKAKGTTIAVLGSGLAHVYPPENKKLFEEIVANGAVISEFSMDTLPLAYNFPRRNRIISGLALGVVVVEASNKSGALITSRFALEQGKEVFAVPGKIDNPNAQGVHNLIKQGAKLISGVEDIIEELKPQFKHYLKEKTVCAESSSGAGVTDNLSDEENILYRQLNSEAVHVDTLVQSSGFSASRAMNVLLKLELRHLVKQLPGKLFVKAS